MGSRSAVIAVAALLGAAPAVQAKTYCCTDESGHRVCGDILPAQCLQRAYQEYNSQGVMSKQIEGPLTPDQRARRQAELARKKVEDRKRADEERHDKALLASYTSVRDIELKRDRMVGDLQAALNLSQERYDTAFGQQQELKRKADAFGDKPVPEPLKLQLKKSQAEVANHQAFIDSRKQEIVEVQKRFEDDKKRYAELTQKRAEEAATHPDAIRTPASSSANR